MKQQILKFFNVYILIYTNFFVEKIFAIILIFKNKFPQFIHKINNLFYKKVNIKT